MTCSINTAFSSYPSRVWRYQQPVTLVLGIFLLATIRSQTGSQLCVDAFRVHNSAAAARATTSTITTTTQLQAKNTQKGKKRSGGPRGGGRRGKPKRDGLVEDEDETSGRNTKTKQLFEPRKLRKRLIELERKVPPAQRQQQQNQQQQQFLPPLRVCSVEVDDREWWEQDGNDNPYGARLWPSALAISEFLVGLSCADVCGQQNQNSLEGYEILELGCGGGLVSIVAAECGANVLASDVSPLATKLCRAGWKETQKLRTSEELAKKKKREQKEKLQKFRRLHDNGASATDTTKEKLTAGVSAADKSRSVDKAGETKPKPGTLNTSILDLFAKKPLPIISSNDDDIISSENARPPKLVIATTMLYESGLATMLAQRALEACQSGAWVVIGDDDTGDREGGRTLFVSELDRLETKEGVAFSRIWTSAKVKSKALQWNEKQVRILHLNAPEDMQEHMENNDSSQFIGSNSTI